MGHSTNHLELVQLNSSKKYSWPTLVLPHSTQSIAIYTCIYYVLTYFAGNFGCYNVHTKVFQLMMTVYPIVTALTGFQVANLVPCFARILPQLLGLYKRAACSHFPEVKPPQADAKNVGPNGEASQIKEISVPNRGLIKAPNGGNRISTISFMSWKSTLVTNQESSPEGGTDPWPKPMTTTPKQDN
ncbi:hypothetical protein DSO57_1034821 [Entomophthora muscae]|uniref:Uncharacterized protein n=1 Tax=Entomophthora muscae TaxID=34485 RepID=A0ACC2U9I0_9FUNG|nr:hypothetical protein DSO57_1034821 [Entomophthora muscae]